MSLIVDANVAIKWFVDERDSDAARALLARPVRLIAPDVIFPELANVVWLKSRTGEIAPDQRAAIIPQVKRMIELFVPAGELAGRALDLSIALDHPAYDCFYLALAERENGAVATADRRLLDRIAGTAFAGLARPLSTA